MAEAGDEDLQGYTINYTQMIGNGTFGFVYEATNKDGKMVAVKVVHFREHHERDIINAKKLLKFKDEHPNILDTYDVLYNKYIFMELCEFGNLRKFFNKRELSTELKIQLMAQMADGIAHLHANNIIHRDVKPENILIQRRGDFPIVKISDFGLSKFMEDDQASAMSSDVGTYVYKAPEFWQRTREGKLQYGRRVDVFALGLTFLAMLQTDSEGNLSPGVEVRGSLDTSEQDQAIGYTMYVRMKNKQNIPNIISDEGNDVTKQVKNLIKRMIHEVSDRRVHSSYVSTKLHGILLPTE